MLQVKIVTIKRKGTSDERDCNYVREEKRQLSPNLLYSKSKKMIGGRTPVTNNLLYKIS